MIINIGYDIELGISTPMALIYLLRVHPSRDHDLLGPENVQMFPSLPVDDYTDSFGNRCGRVNVPAGVPSVRFTNNAQVYDSGLPDEINYGAFQHDPRDLPVSTLQFLLPSRYCEVDSELLGFAWSQFGSTPPGWAPGAGDLRFRAQPPALRLPARARRRALRSRASASGVGVCRDFTHLAVTLCRCMNIPARYVTGYLGDIGIPPVSVPDGLQRLVRGLPRRPLVHLRRAPQHAAHRPHRDGARPRCG